MIFFSPEITTNLSIYLSDKHVPVVLQGGNFICKITHRIVLLENAVLVSVTTVLGGNFRIGELLSRIRTRHTNY